MAGEAAGYVYLSEYVLKTLISNCMAQYHEKCKEIGNVGPYKVAKHKCKDLTILLVGGHLPDLRHSDICISAVDTTLVLSLSPTKTGMCSW